MQRNDIKRVALGGMLAALAIVIMCLGGLIPVATYVCPLLCCVTQYVVLRFCGQRIAWTWYVVVSFLALLMGPDKEAAMVFLAVGYYPIIKQLIDSLKFRVIFKIAYFNISVGIVYAIMIYLMGMQEIAAENMEFGIIGLVVIQLV